MCGDGPASRRERVIPAVDLAGYNPDMPQEDAVNSPISENEERLVFLVREALQRVLRRWQAEA